MPTNPSWNSFHHHEIMFHRETYPITIKSCLIVKLILSSWNCIPSWNLLHHHETQFYRETHPIIMKSYPIVKLIISSWNIILTWNPSKPHQSWNLSYYHETLVHCETHLILKPINTFSQKQFQSFISKL